MCGQSNTASAISSIFQTALGIFNADNLVRRTERAANGPAPTIGEQISAALGVPIPEAFKAQDDAERAVRETGERVTEAVAALIATVLEREEGGDDTFPHTDTEAVAEAILAHKAAVDVYEPLLEAANALAESYSAAAH